MAVIKDGDIISKDALSSHIAQAKEVLKLSEQTTASFKKQAQALKEIVAANKMTGAKDFNSLASSLNESKKALKDFNTQQKAAKDLQKQLADATDENVKGQIRLANARKEQKKLLAEQVALENKELGTKQRLKIENAQLTRALDKLNLKTVEGTKKSKEYINQLNINNEKLKQFSSTQAQGKLTVGQYTDSINKAKIGVMNLASAFGIASGIMLFTNAIKGAFNIIKENEDAFASLSAITGLTGAKFDVFKTAINETANELKVSSTEVAEAAEKIASAQPKLLDNADALAEVTKQAIILNKAIKGDLTETSMALVGVMNQFGLEADQASRIINVLAAGSQAGAATVNQLNASMTKFGTTADLMNISVEESVGLIETLGEKAIFGEEAGTALRNILLKMGAIDVLPKKALKQLEKFGVDTDIVKDKSLSLEERLKELSKVAGDSTAIMQIFGTENATAATVLLNNLDTYSKMTTAVTGTNVAVEQMTINNDTLSNKLEELSAKWSNMITEWSDGKGVGEGLKDVIGFITDNLEEIVKAVILGVKAWVLYKSTLTLVNNAGTGAIQMFANLKKGADGAKFSFGTLAKGLAGIAGIVAILLPYLIEAGKEIWDLVKGTTVLDEVTEKYNEQMGVEKDKMQLLYDQLKETNAGSEERAVIIKKINDTYGTTLQNLSDETEFLLQLEEAYRGVVAQMEKKMMQQIIEEEYLDALKQKRESQKAVDELTTSDYVLDAIGTAATIASLEEAKEKIRLLREEMARLNMVTVDTGKEASRLNRKTFPFDPETSTTAIENTKTLSAELKKLHEEMANQHKIGGAGKIERLEGGLIAPPDEKSKELWRSQFEMMVELQREQVRIEEEARKKRVENIEKVIDATMRLGQAIQDANNMKIAKIEDEISYRKDEISMHNDRIAQMKELAAQGVLTAEDSIKAEEMKVDSLQNRIAELEAKKQKLLTINLALQTAMNLAEAGDPAAIEKAGTQIGQMLDKVKSYKVGTDRTGKGNVDSDGGSLAVIHPDEMIMEAPLTKGLYDRGLDREQTAMYAMRYHDDVMNGQAMSNSSFTDIMTLATLNGIKDGQDKVVELLTELPKKMPVTKTDYDPIQKAIIDAIKTDSEIKRYFTYLRK